jgi:rare lipoprotein A
MLDEVDDHYDGKLGIINQQGNYKVRLGPFLPMLPYAVLRKA